MNSRAYFRRLAIERRRDPSQDERNAAASEAMQAKVAAQLAQSPLIQRLTAAAAEASTSRTG